MTGMQEQVGYNVRAATGNKFFPAPQCQEGRFWVQLLSQLYSRVIQNWSGYNRILNVPGRAQAEVAFVCESDFQRIPKRNNRCANEQTIRVLFDFVGPTTEPNRVRN